MRTLSSTCAASSRVGVTMSARTGWRRAKSCVRLRREPLQQGQREAGGLAGAGLGGAEQVAAGEDYGNGLRLDGGGLGVALVGDCPRELGREAE